MPQKDTTSVSPVRIGLLLIDGFALMSYAAFIEPFRAANSLAGRTLYIWTHITLDGRAVRASNGVTLLAENQIGDAIGVDMLMIFAAGKPADFHDSVCFGWLRQVARQGIVMGGVSGGPYLLARAGLLGGYRVTIHWEHAVALQEEFPTLLLEPGLYVIDRGRVTCAGGTAGLDLAIRLIEDNSGTALATAVGEWFLRSEAREPGQNQRSGLAMRFGTHDTRLLTMLAAMERHIESPLSRDRLAVVVGTSVRHLERLCQSQLGATMSETYMTIRLNAAAQLLRSTDFSVTEVAMATGFRTSSHFSRRFAQKFGHAPSCRESAGDRRG